MALSQKYLEYLAQRAQHKRAHQVGRSARAPGSASLSPSSQGRNGEGSWRESARWLQENFPEQYGELHDLGVSSENPILPNAANAVSAAKPSSGSPTPPAEAESVAIVPGSPQSACTKLGAPLPIPAIAPANSAFWQALLYGNPDGLVSSTDATIALRLVAERIGITIDQSETIATLRAGELRKLLRNKFGQLQAEQTIAALWRSAPLKAFGALAPAPEESQPPPGSSVDSQLQPRWARALHDPDRAQQEWLSDHGVGSC
jgi:hypothetical protein